MTIDSNNDQGKQQSTAAYDSNYVKRKPFPYKSILDNLEKLQDYLNNSHGDDFYRMDYFDYTTYFNNSLDAFVVAVIDDYIAAHTAEIHARRPTPLVKFNYIFEDKAPFVTPRYRDNMRIDKSIVLTNAFRQSTIFDFLIYIGINQNTITVGESINVNNGQNIINVSFEYTPNEINNGLFMYRRKLIDEQKEMEFREAVTNINKVIVPKLEAIYDLAHHLTDIGRIFNIVDSLHATFIKPKTKSKGEDK